MDKPTVFWIDGHYSGGITGIGEAVCPILAELDEGVVVPGQLIQDDPSPDTVHVGLRVRLIFKEVVVGRWIYLFSALPPGKN